MDPDPSSPLNDVSTWIKIMEYMAYAKPIVAFDLKETRFSAGEAAIYVPPNQEAKFAETVAELMGQPELRKKMEPTVVAALRKSCSGTRLAEIF